MELTLEEVLERVLPQDRVAAETHFKMYQKYKSEPFGDIFAETRRILILGLMEHKRTIELRQAKQDGFVKGCKDTEQWYWGQETQEAPELADNVKQITQLHLVVWDGKQVK